MSSIADLRSGFKIYNALIRPLRQMDRDQGNLLLQRYLMGAQARFEETEDTIMSLLDQVKPDEARADLLQYLKDIVGFTNELRGITDRLDETALRRLISVAVPLWGERFTELGMVDTIRLLTGRTAFVATWFGFRNILGEAMIGEDQLVAGGDNWLIGGETSRYDEYWSNIRIMDDGTLDELLLIDILRLTRPTNERFEVFLEDFIDRFEGELDKWETVVATGAEPAIVDNTMTLDCAGTTVQPTVPLYDGTEKNYTIVTKFKFGGSGDSFVVKWLIAGPTFFHRLTITESQLLLERDNGGFLTTLATVALPDAYVSIVPGTWYKLRITTIQPLLADPKHIQIYIDSILEIEVDDGLGPIVGPWTLAAAGTAGHTLYIDNVESWRNPARFATIELSTVEDRGGAVTMTDNFVQ